MLNHQPTLFWGRIVGENKNIFFKSQNAWKDHPTVPQKGPSRDLNPELCYLQVFELLALLSFHFSTS